MPEAGAIIAGKYRLETQIGSGGMAQVWKAEHESLGRPVAIKFLEIAGCASKARTERFLREARTAAVLRHRHVVDIIDYGTTEQGQPFMVMEYLEGETLADRLERGPPLSDAEIVDVVVQLAGGLAAVHDAGIIHRDVKPENVFLVREADGSYPKLLDFGISKGFGDGATQQKLTSTGAVVGTPHYMSPEQARGLRDLDSRTDIYSLGVILYEALSGGVLPFDSENPGDILVMIVTQEPKPIELFRPDLSEELSFVVERALAKERAARFATARELRDALVSLAPTLSGGPPARRAPSRPSTTGQSAADVPTIEAPSVEVPGLRPSRRPLFAGAAALIALGVGGWIAWTSVAGPGASPPVAAPPVAAPAPSPAATARAPEPEAPREPPPAPRIAPAPAAELTAVASDPAPAPAQAPRARAARRSRVSASAAPRPAATTSAAPPVPAPAAPAPSPARRSEPTPRGGYFENLDY